MKDTRLTAWCVLAALAIPACSQTDLGPDRTPLQPTTIVITPESATLTYVGATAEFRAVVTDQNGDIFDATVSWTSSDTDVFTVSSDGEVTATGGGESILIASFGALTADATVIVDQFPFALVAVSGNGQEGTADEPLAAPLVVRVEDSGRGPIEGQLVTFAAAAGDGSADPATAVTDVNGLVQASWTLGAGSGVQLLEASLEDGIAVEFAAAVGTLDPPSGTATYRIDFSATWSTTTHPDDFPGGAHWSPLIGAVHSSRASFWEMGVAASAGMESMAETGATGTLTSEINSEIPANALSVINGSGSGSPGSVRIRNVEVSLDDPLITLVSMIAPSPDWFAGVTGVSLLNGVGQWTESRQVILFPLDAGSDSGTSYTASNANTAPKEPITSLRGLGPFSEAPVATLTITRTDTPGGSGSSRR